MPLIIVLCDVCLFKVKCCFFPLKFTFSYGCMLIILYLILPHYCLFFFFFFYLLSFSFPCTISVRTMDYVCLMSKQTYVLFYSVLVYPHEISIDVHVSLSFLCLLKYWKVLKHFLQTGAYAYNFLTQQLQHKNHGINVFLCKWIDVIEHLNIN